LCGAYMSELTRTKVGKYDISESMSIEDLRNDKNLLIKKIINIDEVLCHFGEIQIKRGIEEKVMHGGFVGELEMKQCVISKEADYKHLVKVKDETGKLLSIAERVENEDHEIIYKPIRVFCQSDH